MILRLWRRRVIVVAGPVIAMLVVLIWSFFAASGISAPVVHYVELRGIANGQHANEVTFSPQDLLLPEILRSVAADLDLDVSSEELRDALTVDFGSPMAEGVVTKFRARLQNRDLDPAQIDALNESFAEELRTTTQRGLRIEVHHRELGLSESDGRQIAQALPEAWSRIFVERFKIFLPVSLPSPTSSGYEFGDLSDTREILIAETAMRNVEQGLRMLGEDNRLSGIATQEGNSFGDLVGALLGLVLLSVDAMPGRDFTYELLNANPGDTRTWRFLAPDALPHELVRTRWTLAEKGVYLTTKYPAWGGGPGSFSTTAVPERTEAKLLPELRRENSHNTYVQVTSELGIGAAAAWVLLLGLALARGIRARRRDLDPDSALLAGFLAAVVGLSVIGLGAHPVLLPELHFTYWLVFAASMGLSQLEELKQPGPHGDSAGRRYIPPMIAISRQASV